MAKDFYEVTNNSVSLCVVSSDSKITGTLESNQDIRIDGSVDGKIICAGKIVIGEGASVKGEIQANDVDLYGRLNAKVTITNNFVLKSSAVFSGECKMKNLISELGAQINLQANMKTNNFDVPEEAASSEEDESLY